MKRLIKFLFAAAALTGVMASCGDDNNDGPTGNGELVLSADKPMIVNDGESAVTFTVKYDGKVVTSSAVIKKDGTAITGAEFTSTEKGTYKFKAEYDGVTSNEVTVVVSAPDQLVLLADKYEIKGDGEDMVTFTVMLNGDDVTENCQICYESGCLPSNIWVSESVGPHTFYAEFIDGGYDQSDEVVITVLPVDRLELGVDNAEIAGNGNDAATFTVTYNGDNVTSAAVIKKDGVVFAGNTFSATEAGDYKFTAEYEGVVSNEVTVKVNPLGAVILKVNKVLIKNDGQDVATFTVECDGDDVTSSAVLKKNGGDFTGTTFSTTEAGIYKFTAVYVNNTSNEVSVSVQPAESEPVMSAEFSATRMLYKSALYLSVTENQCVQCAVLKNNLTVMAPTQRVIAAYIYDPGPSQTVVEPASIDVYRRFMTELRDGSGFSVSEYPTTMVEFDKTFKGNKPIADLQDNYYNAYIASPARTGIKVTSAINGNNAEIGISVGAQVAGNYYVGALLLQNGIAALQWLPDGTRPTNYIHNNVFRDYATSSVYGENLGAFTVGEVKTKNLSVNVNAVDSWGTPIYNKENLSIVVYTLYKDGNKFRIANSVQLPVQGSTGYLYVE